MKHIILVGFSALFLLIFLASLFIPLFQGLMALLIILLFGIGPSIIFGFPSIFLAKNYVTRNIKNRLFSELIIGLFTIGTIYIIELIINTYFLNNISTLNSNILRLILLWLLSRFWYWIFMISFNEYKRRGKYKGYALLTLMAHLILFCVALYAQWRIYTDPYIF